MLILFDQATPVPLRPFLTGHKVTTAAQKGWDRLKNGELLDVAEAAGYDLLITTDRNMPYQQKVEGRRIAVMILSRQQWPELRPHVQVVVEALSAVEPGRCMEVEIPPLVQPN
jgi:hypothetical protein